MPGLSPAPAGMNPEEAEDYKLLGTLPRACGDEPTASDIGIAVNFSPPRLRG